MASDEPVVVKISVEARPSIGRVEWTRAEWDAMTRVQRRDAIEEAVATEIANAGGAGWAIIFGATDEDVADAGETDGPRLTDLMDMIERYAAAIELDEPGDRDAAHDEIEDALRALGAR